MLLFMCFPLELNSGRSVVQVSKTGAKDKKSTGKIIVTFLMPEFIYSFEKKIVMFWISSR